jgi:hypothetical protein
MSEKCLISEKNTFMVSLSKKICKKSKISTGASILVGKNQAIRSKCGEEI